jgi:hypothetical protein
MLLHAVLETQAILEILVETWTCKCCSQSYTYFSKIQSAMKLQNVTIYFNNQTHENLKRQKVKVYKRVSILEIHD